MGLAHLQAAVRGITDYAREHGRWLFTTSPETVTMSIQSLHGWRGDGIIAVLLNRADVRAVQQLGLPTVNFSGALKNPGVPRVMVNNPAVGRMAAEHLLECGFRNFAYYGLRNVNYAQGRADGLIQRLREEGHSCSVFLSPNVFTADRPWQDEMEKLQRWLQTLQPPVGIFAASDPRARMVIEACQEVGLHVPDEVGVVGVDNDQVVCEFSDPPLSSIACDWYRIGYEAAAMLDRLMEGGQVPKEDLLIDPIAVVRRRSTDVLVVDRPEVARAVQFIRENIGRSFGVEALLRETGVARRSLELGFKRSLKCTPHAYICQARIARAKELLAGPVRMKLGAVSRACGFKDLRRFRMVFRRHEGITPAQYRRRQLGLRGVSLPAPAAPLTGVALPDADRLEDTTSVANGGPQHRPDSDPVESLPGEG
jgi:LacI family transcriptional regulator